MRLYLLFWGIPAATIQQSRDPVILRRTGFQMKHAGFRFRKLFL